MNKTELINALSAQSGFTKADTETFFNALLEVTKKELKAGGSIQLVGFGTLSVAKQAARKGHNPSTGEQIKIPAKNVVKFKAGATLKDLVNSKGKKKK